MFEEQAEQHEVNSEQAHWKDAAATEHKYCFRKKMTNSPF